MLIPLIPSPVRGDSAALLGGTGNLGFAFADRVQNFITSKQKLLGVVRKMDDLVCWWIEEIIIHCSFQPRVVQNVLNLFWQVKNLKSVCRGELDQRKYLIRNKRLKTSKG